MPECGGIAAMVSYRHQTVTREAVSPLLAFKTPALITRLLLQLLAAPYLPLQPLQQSPQVRGAFRRAQQPGAAPRNRRGAERAAVGRNGWQPFAALPLAACEEEVPDGNPVLCHQAAMWWHTWDAAERSRRPGGSLL